jgi:hypothetical protein
MSTLIAASDSIPAGGVRLHSPTAQPASSWRVDGVLRALFASIPGRPRKCPLVRYLDRLAGN